MPRSIDVILRDEIVDSVKPGDKCCFVGTLAVVPDITSLKKPGESTTLTMKKDGVRPAMQSNADGVTGLKELGQKDLSYKLVFMANHAASVSNRFNQLDIRSEEDKLDEQIEEEGFDEDLDNRRKQKMFTKDELLEIANMQKDPDLYKHLSESLCPTVCGHDEVKKGILLMLLGGVNKKAKEGINLRGDLNICIVGDPATAKSQFLKYVTSFLPRSVYTSGKASSAAGLTASVTRDPETGEYCIEAGALMLADHGSSLAFDYYVRDLLY